MLIRQGEREGHFSKGYSNDEFFLPGALCTVMPAKSPVLCGFKKSLSAQIAERPIYTVMISMDQLNGIITPALMPNHVSVSPSAKTLCIFMFAHSFRFSFRS